jgi:hypothetical protein
VPVPPPPPVADVKTIELEFAYGSEKQKWIEAVTARFNSGNSTIPSGERIVVKPFASGSGEIIDELLTERRKPHIISPAAGAFVEIGNSASREQNKGDLIGVNRTDVNKPEVKDYLRDVEKAVPYYETSTGFLARRMIQDGPASLTAAIVYENLVIEANKANAAANKPPRVVAIYPEEGTFPSEHPIGIVERPWVTEKHRQAAEAYINFLRDRPQQEDAKQYGFRPYDSSIALDDILTPALGVDASRPKTLLKAPPASAISIIRETWREVKNPNATLARGR